MIQAGIGFDGSDDGPRDEMGKAEFAFALEGALLVDKITIFFDDADRNLALRGGHGDGQAGRHVLGNAGGRATNRNELIARASDTSVEFGGAVVCLGMTTSVTVTAGGGAAAAGAGTGACGASGAGATGSAATGVDSVAVGSVAVGTGSGTAAKGSTAASGGWTTPFSAMVCGGGSSTAMGAAFSSS